MCKKSKESEESRVTDADSTLNSGQESIQQCTCRAQAPIDTSSFRKIHLKNDSFRSECSLIDQCKQQRMQELKATRETVPSSIKQTYRHKG